jgi:regulator of RNase E activity RraB
MSDAANADAHAIQGLVAVSDGDAVHRIFHYLYAPSSEAADKIAEELRQRGFGTEVRFSAYGKNWLVLAQHEAVPSAKLIASMRLLLETLAAKAGGEYDGWETEMRPYGQSPSRLH